MYYIYLHSLTTFHKPAQYVSIHGICTVSIGTLYSHYRGTFCSRILDKGEFQLWQRVQLRLITPGEVYICQLFHSLPRERRTNLFWRMSVAVAILMLCHASLGKKARSKARSRAITWFVMCIVVVYTREVCCPNSIYQYMIEEFHV